MALISCTVQFTQLERLLHACECELAWLDMAINFSQSCCIRVGPRCDTITDTINSLTGHTISWAKEMRYLGVYFVQSRTMKCSLDVAKRGFYRTANGIFGKIGRTFVTGGSQQVMCNGLRSTIQYLQFGVQHGSVSGPKLFVMYTAELSHVVAQHYLKFHQYADDCQIYVSTLVKSRLYREPNHITCVLLAFNLDMGVTPVLKIRLT